MAKMPKGAAPKSRDETLDLPDWLLLFDGGDIKEFLAKLRHTFRRVYIVMLVALLVLIPLSIALNGTGVRWINLIPLALMAAFAIYHALEPYKFLAWFGFGVVNYGGIPNTRIMEVLKLNFPDFELTKFLRAGGQGVKFGWDILAVIWMFFFMWFMVFATVRVEPGPAYFFLFVLMAWGAISIKWPATAPWYKRICIAITLLFTGIFLYQGLIAKTDWWQQFRAKTITVEHPISDARTTRLANFPDPNGNGRLDADERQPVKVLDGCYTFTVSGPDTTWNHRSGLYRLDGGLLRMGTLDDEGREGTRYFPDQVFEVKGGNALVYLDSQFGKGQVVDDTGQQVTKTAHIVLTPATCP